MKRLVCEMCGSTVKVDNSSFVQKSLENARRAKSKEDWEECEKYYNSTILKTSKQFSIRAMVKPRWLWSNLTDLRENRRSMF